VAGVENGQEGKDSLLKYLIIPIFLRLASNITDLSK